ncbi:histone deacetylase HDT2-like isoform X2 [Salvia splendens]|uniref:histone deacetylase HDT2-like isoform X2 n=1 Tax=Salvia splendens TaxID=180675 RepID=UPI001C276F94|nr:histone deacetylase HDT2-like isoform X2 [Salvia splendens]
MEFWGVEVKAGEKLKVEPELGKLIHISQAAMGEVKDVKSAKNVHLRMKIDDKDFIIGSLAAENRPQVMFDLVFEKEFELSHDLKNGSVYFIGYIADDPVSEGEDYSEFDDESDDEELPIEVPAQENGAAKAKAVDAKPPGKAKKEEKKEEKVELKVEEEKASDDDDEDDSDADMALDDSDLSGDSDDEEDDEDSSEEDSPPKANQSNKKRPAPADKAPAAKKVKAATPDKPGKKGQNATPIPAKSAGKTPNKQSPKSGGQANGNKSFNKNFSSAKKGKGKFGGK